MFLFGEIFKKSSYLYLNTLKETKQCGDQLIKIHLTCVETIQNFVETCNFEIFNYVYLFVPGCHFFYYFCLSNVRGGMKLLLKLCFMLPCFYLYVLQLSVIECWLFKKNYVVSK